MRKQKPSKKFSIGKLKLNRANLLGERTKKKLPKLSNAFSVKSLEEFLSQFQVEQLHQVYFQTRQYNYWWIWALSNGPHVREQPWRIFYASQENPRLRDYLSIAACLAFAWRRIQPLSFKEDVPIASINLLMQTQLRSGAWPTYADESEPCLLTTCYAVHAIALWRPHGWERTLATAAEWLWSQQNKFGNWSIYSIRQSSLETAVVQFSIPLEKLSELLQRELTTGATEILMTSLG